MKDQSATALQPLREIAPLKPFTDDFCQRSKEISDSIARRAFEIFESSGRISGRDHDDWLKAEAELLHPIHLDIAESHEAVTVRVEVPGFSAKDLDIRLEPRRLAITGERETREDRKTEKNLYSERCVDQVFRVIDLPAEVDPEKTTATLKDGILQLAMPKTVAARNVKAEAKAV
jgi:HSP20 family molecular chaperone IbpA